MVWCVGWALLGTGLGRRDGVMDGAGGCGSGDGFRWDWWCDWIWWGEGWLGYRRYTAPERGVSVLWSGEMI